MALLLHTRMLQMHTRPTCKSRQRLRKSVVEEEVRVLNLGLIANAPSSQEPQNHTEASMNRGIHTGMKERYVKVTDLRGMEKRMKKRHERY